MCPWTWPAVTSPTSRLRSRDRRSGIHTRTTKAPPSQLAGNRRGLRFYYKHLYRHPYATQIQPQRRERKTPMILENCHKCKLPIMPGEPAWQEASVDVIGGRVVASPARLSHGRAGCEAAMERETPNPSQRHSQPRRLPVDEPHLTRPRWSNQRPAGSRHVRKEPNTRLREKKK